MTHIRSFPSDHPRLLLVPDRRSLPPEEFEATSGQTPGQQRASAMRSRLVEIAGSEHTYCALQSVFVTGELTLAELAWEMGVDRSTVWRWMRRIRRNAPEELLETDTNDATPEPSIEGSVIHGTAP
jgi:hypothetical protein